MLLCAVFNAKSNYMKKINLRVLLSLFVVMFYTTSVSAQGQLKGRIVDKETGVSIPGVNIVQEGTVNGTSTDIEGRFIFNVSGKGNLVISAIGYENKLVAYDDTKNTNLGDILLKTDIESLEEVVVIGSGLIDLVKDRQTPIAATTIKADIIREKLGNLEFPEVLKGVPSVHSMNTGGYGDGSYTVRGFDQANILVLINGQPVNDMEWGGVYWSNWSGLADIASVVQQQRGLGSSKIGIPSVGGTTNIVTKAADKSKGGFFKETVANDSFMKTTASYNSGIGENGWAVSALLSYWKGDGYMQATEGEGATYFFSVGYKPNEKHSFNFMITGAPQTHQGDYREKISTYEKYGYKYNSNWGYRNGEAFSFSTNYYHKPIANLNWDWKISEKVSLSTVAYGSWGIGGGTGSFGTAYYKLPDDENGHVKIDDLIKANQGQTVDGFKTVPEWSGVDGKNSYWTGKRVVEEFGPGTVLRSSMNQHSWYGLLSSVDVKFTDNLILNTGLDLRTYTGKHFRVLNDLLGADAYFDATDVNNAGVFVNSGIARSALLSADIINAKKVDRNYDSHVNWAGWFGQLEYSNEYLSAFVQGSLSQQSYRRQEFFEVPSDIAKTDWNSIGGGNVKAGINWRINNDNNVFFNAGYFSRQPFFTAIYPNSYTPKANDRVEVDNEKITSFEAGYAFSTPYFKSVLNLYYSQWDDRYKRFNANDAGGNRRTARTYIGEIHQGIELELAGHPTSSLDLFGMISYGDWKYSDNGNADLVDDLGNPIAGSSATLYLKDIETGGSPQFQTRLGVKYKIIKGLSVDADWYYNAKNFSYIDAKRFTKEDSKSLELPSYSTFDAGISYELAFDNGFAKSLSFRLNVNNIFDELYIARGYSNYEADTDDANNWNGINKKNTVEFGYGTTWNFSATLKF